MKYRVTNITKKPGVKKGPFRRGHFVDVKPAGKVRPMGVGDHVDVDEITPGMMAMQEKGLISIKPIPDLDVQLKKQIEKNEAKEQAKLKKATKEMVDEKKKELDDTKEEIKEVTKPVEETSKPTSGLDKAAMKKDAQPSKKETDAKVSGETEDTDPLGDLDDGVNPDGEPNFLVKPSTKKKAGSKKAKSKKSS